MMEPRMEPRPVIGLEVHLQLSTASKIFCGCPVAHGAPPNSNICAVCSGQPGALPVLNHAAVEAAVRLALATGAEVQQRSRFARKNYFYPDLPKGYQITQYEEPLALGGRLQLLLDDRSRQVALTRIHLEEDAGKSLHPGDGITLVDLNRAGVPLVEIVTEPCLVRPTEAAQTMRILRQLVRALGISDGNMEQGSLRCDANISLRQGGRPGSRVELKNLNSFRFVQRALTHEIQRQRQLLSRGVPVRPQTRAWDARRNVTVLLRSKEEAGDYRYFPEPDLPPLQLERAWIQGLEARLPELPLARQQRLMTQLGLSRQVAVELIREPALADYLERAVAAGAPARRAASWIQNELLSRIDDAREVPAAPVAPEQLADVLALLQARKVSGTQARKIFSLMWQGDRRPAAQIAADRGLLPGHDAAALDAAVRKVLARYPAQVEQYHGGKHQLLGFFVGRVMQATHGKADPPEVNRVLKKQLRG